MKCDGRIIEDLALFLDLDPDADEIDAEAFDRLGFPFPADHYAPDLIRTLLLELERRREAGALVREYDEDGSGLLYYPPAAADGDEDTRGEASVRTVQEIAGDISASFVGPWP